MPSLPELQRYMMDALLDGATADPRANASVAAWLAAPPEAAATGFEVYRNNISGNFIASLASSFPALRRLVGDDYFRQTAREFQRRQPSRSGDLQHVGRPFADFLSELHATGEYRYLPDIARLEWLVQETLLAAAHTPFDLQKLAGVDPAAYDGLRFELHPSVRLFESDFPAHRIWQQNIGAGEPELIDLTSGGDRLAIARHGLDLEFHRSSRGEFAFLKALRRGAGFASAVADGEAAGESGAGGLGGPFDATAVLHRLVVNHLIVDFR